LSWITIFIIHAYFTHIAASSIAITDVKIRPRIEYFIPTQNITILLFY